MTTFDSVTNKMQYIAIYVKLKLCIICYTLCVLYYKIVDCNIVFFVGFGVKNQLFSDVMTFESGYS
jgi:hypothetical protein